MTDDEDSRYMGFYVGQSTQPRKRIMQHISFAAGQIPSTLHYFIICKGNGRRAMNFLRLWTIHDHDLLDEESSIIFANLLEKSLAMAFHSLSLPDAQVFFGDQLSTNYSNVGLNVLSPLYQGIGRRYHVRQVLTSEVQTSADPQIRSWSAYRRETQASAMCVTAWHNRQVLTGWSEYLDLFLSAIKATGAPIEDVPLLDSAAFSNESKSHVTLAREKLSMELHLLTKECVRQEYPVGNPGSKIGIILSKCILSPGADDIGIENVVP